MKSMKILCFGDSITSGYDDDVKGGWVNRLKAMFGKKYEFVNFGVPGYTSSDLLNRIEEELEHYTNGTTIIIAIGVNDSRIDSGQNVAEIKDYVKNLDKILNLAKKVTDKIIFVGLAPCEDSLTNPVDWSDTIYKNSRISEFDEALRKFCEKNGSAYVRIFEPFKEAERDYSMLPDGIHPNETGHQLIADLIKPQLQKLIKR